MRRIHLKKKWKVPKLQKNHLLLTSFLLILICVIFLFQLFDKKITPVLVQHAEVQAKRVVLLVMTEAVSDMIDLQTSMDELFIIVKNEDDSIKSIDYNPITMNKLLTLLATNVRIYLQNLESGKVDDMKFVNSGMNISLSKLKNGVISEIPSGLVFGNSLLSNLGPKIPVRLNLIGDIGVDLKTNITNFGINNALLEISIHMEVSERVVLPFESKTLTVTTDIPLSVKLIQGTVPNYYYNGLGDPSISLPT